MAPENRLTSTKPSGFFTGFVPKNQKELLMPHTKFLDIFGIGKDDPASPDPLLETLISGASEIPQWKNVDAYLQGRGDVGFQGVLPDFAKQLEGVKLDRQSLDALKARGLSQGNSAWADMMLQQEGVERGARMDEASALNNSAQARAFSALATRGGSSAGQRERIARQMAKDMMTNRQAVNRQGQLDRLGIMTQDDQQKLAILQATQGMELGAAGLDLNKVNAWGNVATSDAGRKQNLDLSNRQYQTDIDRFNTENKINERDKRMQFDLGRWKEQLGAWAADRTARAQEAQGSGGKK